VNCPLLPDFNPIFSRDEPLFELVNRCSHAFDVFDYLLAVLNYEL
jgi:hypothetical protein